MEQGRIPGDPPQIQQGSEKGKIRFSHLQAFCQGLDGVAYLVADIPERIQNLPDDFLRPGFDFFRKQKKQVDIGIGGKLLSSEPAQSQDDALRFVLALAEPAAYLQAVEYGNDKDIDERGMPAGHRQARLPPFVPFQELLPLLQ